MDTIAGRVKAIVMEELGVDADEVTPEASIRDDLGADSLDQIQLTMALEEAFGLEIADEDAEPILRVGDIVAYLEMRLTAARQPA